MCDADRVCFPLAGRVGVRLGASASMQLLRTTAQSPDLPKAILLPALPHSQFRPHNQCRDLWICVDFFCLIVLSA